MNKVYHINHKMNSLGRKNSRKTHRLLQSYNNRWVPRGDKLHNIDFSPEIWYNNRAIYI